MREEAAQTVDPGERAFGVATAIAVVAGGIVAFLYAFLLADSNGQGWAAMVSMASNVVVVAITYIIVVVLVRNQPTVVGLQQLVTRINDVETNVMQTTVDSQTHIGVKIAELEATVIAASAAPAVLAYYARLQDQVTDFRRELERSTRVHVLAQYLAGWFTLFGNDVVDFLSKEGNELHVTLTDPRDKCIAETVKRQALWPEVPSAQEQMTVQVLRDVRRCFHVHEEATSRAREAGNGQPGNLRVAVVREQINYLGVNFDDRTVLLTFLPHSGETESPAVRLDIAQAPDALAFWRRDLEYLYGASQLLSELTDNDHAERLLRQATNPDA